MMRSMIVQIAIPALAGKLIERFWPKDDGVSS